MSARCAERCPHQTPGPLTAPALLPSAIQASRAARRALQLVSAVSRERQLWPVRIASDGAPIAPVAILAGWTLASESLAERKRSRRQGYFALSSPQQSDASNNIRPRKRAVGTNSRRQFPHYHAAAIRRVFSSSLWLRLHGTSFRPWPIAADAGRRHRGGARRCRRLDDRLAIGPFTQEQILDFVAG